MSDSSPTASESIYSHPELAPPPKRPLWVRFFVKRLTTRRQARNTIFLWFVWALVAILFLSIPSPQPYVRRGSDFDVKLILARNDALVMPNEGKNLIVVASSNNILHFRIFDRDGNVYADTDETKLDKDVNLERLKMMLQNVWPPHELTKIETTSIVNLSSGVVELPPPPPAPRSWTSHALNIFWVVYLVCTLIAFVVHWRAIRWVDQHGQWPSAPPGSPALERTITVPRPLWVRLVLGRASTRPEANRPVVIVIYFLVLFIIGLVIYSSFGKPNALESLAEYVIPIAGAFFAISIPWLWLAFRWVDRHGAWAQLLVKKE